MRIPETGRGRAFAAAGVITAAAVIFVLYRKFFPEFDLQQLLDDFANLLGAWTYLLIALLTFLETGAFVGLIVPGETALLIAGAVAGQGVINVYLLIAIAWICAFLGDSTSFWLGHKLGREFILKHGSRVAITPERYAQVEDYFEKHGGKTVLIGRFVGLVRALAPFVAGSSGMRYRAFAPYSILGGGLQVSIHILAGYLFARSIEAAAEYVGLVAVIVGSLIVVVVCFIVIRRWLRVPENRVRLKRGLESNPVSGPVVRFLTRFGPQYRFLEDRFRPGGTFGLEVTTLCAILAVSSFIVIAFTEILLNNGGPTPGDLRAIDVVEAIRVGWLNDVAQVVTDLGSGAVLTPLVAVTATLLLVGKRWTEAAVLLLSAVTIMFGVDWLKDLVERPRPEGGMTAHSSWSFPSGHAAYSV
ncbi:MAG: VTT domain-containing protein, partial [Actinomycetota bacterium]|nr:VTT domain-containing protein [Actinomycetota bacterium]